MEQSREGYQRMVEGVEEGKKHDERQEYLLESEDSIHKFFRPAQALEKKILDVLGQGAAGAEQKLQKYLEDGHAEALELNRMYEVYKKDVYAAQEDLKEFTQAHADALDESAPAWKQLEQRINQAVYLLEMFEQEHLGMKPKEETSEAA